MTSASPSGHTSGTPSGRQGSRTSRFLAVAQASLPLDHGIVSPVTEAGVEPAGTRLSTSPLCQFAYPVVNDGSGSCTRLSRLTNLRSVPDPVEPTPTRRRRGRWTTGPSSEAEAVGLEPTSSMSAAACLPSRFLNHSDGFRISRKVPGGGIEPPASWFRARRHYQQQLSRIVVSLRQGLSASSSGRRGRTPSPRINLASA
jgi:hypothetical protein